MTNTTPKSETTAVSKFELIFTNWEGSQVERSRNVSSLSRYAGSSKKRMPGMRSKASINSVLTVIIDLSERSVFTHVSNDFTAADHHKAARINNGPYLCIDGVVVFYNAVDHLF
nr:hypothetical protein P5651_04355 [Bacillus subtilis]